jgi:hypothetical protein
MSLKNQGKRIESSQSLAISETNKACRHTTNTIFFFLISNNSLIESVRASHKVKNLQSLSFSHTTSYHFMIYRTGYRGFKEHSKKHSTHVCLTKIKILCQRQVDRIPRFLTELDTEARFDVKDK